MPYVLEKISLEDQQKILNDANCDERKKRFLLMRGGHFENNPDLNWAIDRISGFYMFWAPRVGEPGRHHNYYFYFKRNLYAIHIDIPYGNVVYFDDVSFLSPLLLNELQEEVKNAFAVYGRLGEGNRNGDIPMLAIFEKGV